MDEKKIDKLNVEQVKSSQKDNMKNNEKFFHTNPILKKFFAVNEQSKKYKFSLKDLFR